MNIQGKTHDSTEDACTALELYNMYRDIVREGGFSYLTKVIEELYQTGFQLNWKIPDLDMTCSLTAWVNRDVFSFHRCCCASMYYATVSNTVTWCLDFHYVRFYIYLVWVSDSTVVTLSKCRLFMLREKKWMDLYFMILFFFVQQKTTELFTSWKQFLYVNECILSTVNGLLFYVRKWRMYMNTWLLD